VTDNAFELASKYNKEMAFVNHSRQMADALHEIKLAQWMPESEAFKKSAKFEQIGDVSKYHNFKTKEGQPFLDEQGNQIRQKLVLVGAKGVVDALKPIFERDKLPDTLDAVGLGGVQKAQGFVKTMLLSYSFFHDKAMTLQTLASERGWKTLADFPNALKSGEMDTPVWRDKESRGVKAGLMTTMVSDIEDVMRHQELDQDSLGKFLNKPVAKQMYDIAQMHTKFLFDLFQRYDKVETFSKNIEAWEKRFPDATKEQLAEAEKGFADATNAAFGGLNWANLGMTKTQVSTARLVLLAPDWFLSAYHMGKYALTDWGKTPGKALIGTAMDATAGQQARGTLFKAVLGGYLYGNALSYLLHGTGMSDNNKAHRNEVEIAPDVYLSPFAGGPGEAIKVWADIEESGTAGLGRYLQGKMSPGLAAAVTLIGQKNYYGGNIFHGDTEFEKILHATWDVSSHMLPVPIAVGGAFGYGGREDAEDRTGLGWAGVLTGLGRFSKRQAEE
jgi:hypothetical protein